MIAALIALGAIGAWAMLATGTAIATDSYRRVPTQPELLTR